MNEKYLLIINVMDIILKENVEICLTSLTGDRFMCGMCTVVKSLILTVTFT